MSPRPRPRYGPSGLRVPDRLAAAGLGAKTPAGLRFVAVDLCCRECGRRLWRYGQSTFAGADPDIWVEARRKGGQELGYIPRVENDLVLIDCEHCERDVDVPLANIRAVLEHLKAPERHAVETLPV